MTTVSDLLANAQPGTTWILDRNRSTVTVRNKTFWGAVTVKGTFSNSQIHGKMNGGGQPVVIHTGDGSIRLSKS